MSTQAKDQTNIVADAKIAQSADLFASSEYKGAELLAAALGTNPTFIDWEKVREAWKKAYAAKRVALAKDCSLDAAQKAWERAADLMAAFFGLEKPKSTSQAATKKAASRTKAQKETDKVIKSHVSAKDNAQTIAEKAGDLLKAGKVAEARILTDVAAKRQKEADKAAADKVKAETAKVRKTLKEAIDKAQGPELMALTYAAAHPKEFLAWYTAQVAAKMKKAA